MTSNIPGGQYRKNITNSLNIIMPINNKIHLNFYLNFDYFLILKIFRTQYNYIAYLR